MKIRGKRWNPRNLIYFLTVIFVTLVVINLFSGLNPIEASGNKTYKTIIVNEGDNLWNLAAKYSPTKDSRIVVAEIVRINELSGVSIIPGQVLDIPQN
ncbi:MAG TPA: LysM peptidoglycan-binding domain-containing protein [Desulfobacteria bacterium]|nr:LysM peptidoglycan-binding domain-containing protein [Desulfobacteria bacterium]